MTDKATIAEPEKTEVSPPENTEHPSQSAAFAKAFAKATEADPGHAEVERPGGGTVVSTDPQQDTTDDAKAEPEFSATAIKRAELLGLDEEDLDSFDSEDSLVRALNLMERRTPTVRKDDAATPGDAVTEEFDLGLSVDDYDEDMIGVLNKITARAEERANALEAKYNSLREELGNKAEGDFHQEVNSYFDGLDKEEKVLFDRRTRAGRTNRATLTKCANVFKVGLKASKLPPMSTSELLKRALRTEFGDQITPARRDEKTLQDHALRMTPRPTRASNGAVSTGSREERLSQFEKKFNELNR